MSPIECPSQRQLSLAIDLCNNTMNTDIHTLEGRPKTASELGFLLSSFRFAIYKTTQLYLRHPLKLFKPGSSDMWVNGASVCLPGTYSNSSAPATKKKRYASSVLEGFELTATYASTYFDKVSSDFIAPAPTGTAASASAATGINCAQYGAFNPDLSSSWKELNLGEPFGIEYVDTTQATGVYGTDSLSINGVSVPNTTFAVASFSNSSQGVLGISLPRDESLFADFNNGTTYNNLPQTLKADGLISKVSYSLFLNSLCDQSGSLLFGAVNPDWYTRY